MVFDHSVTRYHRDLETVFFDCTNNYYDISKPDIDDLDDEGNVILQRYRKYGPEKNHRKDPIVELGLLMDVRARRKRSKSARRNRPIKAKQKWPTTQRH